MAIVPAANNYGRIGLERRGEENLTINKRIGSEGREEPKKVDTTEVTDRSPVTL